MKLNRREFIKANAAAAAAAAAGMQLPAATALAAKPADDIRWDKAPCRFCGTGCSVLVGTQSGRVVATQGDPDAPVNRGLNCIKGYFLSKIMYGEDRGKTPLLRKKGGKYDKDGEFTPVSWDEAFDVMAQKWKEALKAKGPTSVGMFGSGQWTVWEGYAASKLFKAGFRSNNLDPNARHCMASAVAGFIRTFGIDEPMGCHVPREWVYKIRRKIQASNELWHHMLGTVDTPEKFDAKRAVLAQHEWDRMKANNSRECRNCHDYESMDYTEQGRRATDNHSRGFDEGKTCIDCHKGIAHALPPIDQKIAASGSSAAEEK